MIFDEKNFELIDASEKITIADSFVHPAQKLGRGHGEAKLYIGNKSKELWDLFGSEKGFILDGFPRTVNQAKKLDFLLSDKYKLDCVLRIKVDEQEIIKRLIDRAREDDKPDIIKNRFKAYNLETQPLIPFYQERKILFNINGMQKIEKVSEEIKNVIGAI